MGGKSLAAPQGEGYTGVLSSASIFSNALTAQHMQNKYFYLPASAFRSLATFIASLLLLWKQGNHLGEPIVHSTGPVTDSLC